MKAQNEHAGIAAKNFLRRYVLMNTKGQCMKESKGSLAEHQRGIHTISLRAMWQTIFSEGISG